MLGLGQEGGKHGFKGCRQHDGTEHRYRSLLD